MFNNTVNYIGRKLFIVATFLALGFTCSWASTSEKNGILKEESPSISQIGSDVLVQDLTIKLEKKVPKVDEYEDLSISQVDNDALAQRVTIKQDVTIKLEKKLPNTDDYEDMEDPFAGSEEDLPILSDPLEGYNRWMFGIIRFQWTRYRL